MSRVLIVLVFFVCCGATCGPLHTNFQVAGNPVVQDKEAQVTVSLEAGDAHYTGGNAFTVFFKIVNNAKDTLYVRQFPPFTLHTQNLALSPRDGAVIHPGSMMLVQTAVLAVNPSDSLKAFYTFSNEFRGSYKKFRKMLGDAKLFINLHDIVLNGKELQFEEQEFVVEEKNTTATTK